MSTPSEVGLDHGPECDCAQCDALDELARDAQAMNCERVATEAALKVFFYLDQKKTALTSNEQRIFELVEPVFDIVREVDSPGDSHLLGRGGVGDLETVAPPRFLGAVPRRGQQRRKSEKAFRRVNALIETLRNRGKS